MRSRLELQTKLEEVMGDRGPVYFQPPSGYLMKYPCIVYELDSRQTYFADNNPFIQEKRYQVTVIDADPDTPIPDEIANFQKCLMDRHFKLENLNHYIFNLYF